METGIRLIFDWKMGLTLLGLACLKVRVGKINKMGLGYVNHKKVNTIILVDISLQFRKNPLFS